MASKKAWAIVAGVGPGTGASVARRFAQSYNIALLARNPSNFESLVSEINDAGGHAVGISTDTSDADSVIAAFNKLKNEEGLGGENGKLAAAIYNVGGRFIRKGFLDLTDEEFELGWKTNGLGAFYFSKQVLPLLLESASGSSVSTATADLHPPTLIFTSATAAMRGGALFASFSTGKFAMRSLSQSLAREFGPKGVHVAHAIIDGVIDIPRTAEWKFEHPDAKIDPESIAETYWHLHTQPRTSFTYEFDIRPYVEKW